MFKINQLRSMLLVSLLSVVSLSANAADSSYVFAYPKNHMNAAMTNFASEASTLNSHDANAISGFITKVYQIGDGTNPSAIGKVMTGACSTQINPNDPFFNSCFDTQTPMDTKADSWGVINGWKNTPSNYSSSLAARVVTSLINNKFQNYYSGVVLDTEQGDTPVTQNRAPFYQTIFSQFNANNVPVGIYINPNTADFTSKDAAVLNPLITPTMIGSSPNLYLMSLYGANPKSVNNALSLIGPNHPFKFIVEVDKTGDISAQTSILKQALASHPKMMTSFKGVDYYQYTEAGKAPQLNSVKDVQSAIEQVKQERLG